MTTNPQSNAIAAYRERLRQELASLHTRIAPQSGNRISLRGKVFSMPDGSIHRGPIAAVILDWRNHNAYWNVPYNPQQPADPVCFALSREFHDLAPSPECSAPQAERCALCAKNVFGSAMNGKAKACKNTRRLAIVPPDATPETEPMILHTSPTAIGAFESYVTTLAADDAGLMPVQVITHIAFKPNTDYPTLVFGKPTPLPDDRLAVMMELREKAQLALDVRGQRPANDGASH
jgi:hypothetical protein